MLHAVGSWSTWQATEDHAVQVLVYAAVPGLWQEEQISTLYTGTCRSILKNCLI